MDKMFENYQYLGLIGVLFPRAQLIHCRRDLRDVALSCWMTHLASVPWACDSEQIISRFEGYLRLMDHWRKVLPSPLVDVDYEELVEDPEGVAAGSSTPASWNGNRRAFAFMKRNGRYEPPARCKSGRRFTRVPSDAGRDTKSRWASCFPKFASLKKHGPNSSQQARPMRRPCSAVKWKE